MNQIFLQSFEDNRLNLNEEEINFLIKNNKLDTNKISDGFHNFGELYTHRIALFIALCNVIKKQQDAFNNSFPMYTDDASKVWRSNAHSDGTVWDGWFLLGINKEQGKQITYHLPVSYWDECNFAETLDIAPSFDGHSANDILERLKTI